MFKGYEYFSNVQRQKPIFYKKINKSCVEKPTDGITQGPFRVE